MDSRVIVDAFGTINLLLYDLYVQVRGYLLQPKPTIIIVFTIRERCSRRLIPLLIIYTIKCYKSKCNLEMLAALLILFDAVLCILIVEVLRGLFDSETFYYLTGPVTKVESQPEILENYPAVPFLTYS